MWAAGAGGKGKVEARGRCGRVEVERVRWKKLVVGRRVGVKWDVTVQWSGGMKGNWRWGSGEVDRYGLKCKGLQGVLTYGLLYKF